MDQKRIEAAVRELLLAIGENPDREGLLETPRRVAAMYEEVFSGLQDDPRRHLKLFQEGNNDEMVIVRIFQCIPCVSTICFLLSGGLILHISRVMAG